MSLYDYCNGDPVNGIDPDGRFGKGVASGWSGNIGAGDPNSSAFSAGLIFGGSASGGVEGLGTGVQNVSGYTSYQQHLAMFDGDSYMAANAAWNPAYMAMRGSIEAAGGMGLSPSNLGQDLSAGQRVWSGVEGTLGAVGTVGVSVGVTSVGSASISAFRSGMADGLGSAAQASLPKGPGIVEVPQNFTPIAAERETIVVGEGMDRVQAFADEMAQQGIKVRTYSAQNMNRSINPNVYGSAKSLDANWHWADYWARGKGADVIDIGLQPGRTTPSPYYNMEWQNLYRWEKNGEISPVMRIDPGY